MSDGLSDSGGGNSTRKAYEPRPRMADKTIQRVPDDLGPGDAIWDEVWERSNPDSPRYANHLRQLFEAKLQVASLQQEVERLKGAEKILYDNQRQLLKEAEKRESENATLRAQLLESGRITDEALAQRDEALGKAEEFERKGKDLCSAYGNSLVTIHDLERTVERQQRAVTDEELLLLLTNCRNGLELLLASHKPERPDDTWDTINELRETVRKSTEAIASRTPAPSQPEEGEKG